MRILLLMTLALMALPTSAASSFSEQMTAFRAQLLLADPVARYNLIGINRAFPKVLLSPDSLLPQTANYPLKDIRRLYQAAQKCQGPWPVHPKVTEPLVFTRAMCNHTQLPVAWFSRSGFIHPGGGSYAAKYVEQFPSRRSELTRFFHIQERPTAQPDTWLGRLQRMDTAAVEALNSGAKSLLSSDEMWVRVGSYYHLYPSTQWQPLLAEFDLRLSAMGEQDFCLARVGNICWNEEKAPTYWPYLVGALIVINLAALGGWAFNRWTVQRRLMQERMLVLQILTHELRTPIASLSMTVEGFRRKFDTLPESFYDEFRRLCEDARRLKQLAEASKDYLQSNQKPLNKETIPSLKEWLGYICDEHNVTMYVSQDGAVSANVYWLATSLNNLIANAVKYGVAPVEVRAQVLSDRFTIAIQDQGDLTAKDWKHIRKPFVSQSGLGLGLTIVESMIERMGGKLSLSGPPTTFTLEIHCDASDVTSG
ncbi:histidine kinase [Salinivibrio sp. IB872]|nr:histidine kinase [Salinivibrio sp. IB872]